MFYHVRKIWNTALFQGANRKKRYFEGWYFKHVSPEGRVYAVIPGVAISADGQNRHAFIQTIDGNTLETHYITFPFKDFSFGKDRFFVAIGDNRFSLDGIELNLEDAGFRCEAHCSYKAVRGLPFSLLNPNAMGWYSFVPRMECYHGLVSMDHSLRGRFEVNGESISLDGGRGYIEKDWGRSFPSSWVWMQTNSFDTPSDSFMLSIARIPWLGSYFVGFLGFASVSGEVYRFATYTGARITSLEITESTARVVISSGNLIIRIAGRKSRKGILQAPVNGAMERRINESIDAEIAIEIKDNGGNVVFDDVGGFGGLEIVGNPEELIAELGSQPSRARLPNRTRLDPPIRDKPRKRSV